MCEKCLYLKVNFKGFVHEKQFQFVSIPKFSLSNIWPI